PGIEGADHPTVGWGIVPNDAFFLGGIEKRRVLSSLRPHIFFDDQEGHLHDVFAAVHIPPVDPSLSEREGPLPLRPAKRAEPSTPLPRVTKRAR
ncbi:MAG: 5'-nucleotidase, partial [Myxococcota bacterium]